MGGVHQPGVGRQRAYPRARGRQRRRREGPPPGRGVALDGREDEDRLAQVTGGDDLRDLPVQTRSLPGGHGDGPRVDPCAAPPAPSRCRRRGAHGRRRATPTSDPVGRPPRPARRWPAPRRRPPRTGPGRGTRTARRTAAAPMRSWPAAGCHRRTSAGTAAGAGGPPRAGGGCRPGRGRGRSGTGSRRWPPPRAHRGRRARRRRGVRARAGWTSAAGPASVSSSR